MSFETFCLLVIIAVDVLCWWEARQANHVMKLYFKERRRWYEARAKQPKTVTESATPVGRIPLDGNTVAKDI